jgi:hypothetical protein
MSMDFSRLIKVLTRASIPNLVVLGFSFLATFRSFDGSSHELESMTIGHAIYYALLLGLYYCIFGVAFHTLRWLWERYRANATDAESRAGMGAAPQYYIRHGARWEFENGKPITPPRCGRCDIDMLRVKDNSDEGWKCTECGFYLNWAQGQSRTLLEDVAAYAQRDLRIDDLTSFGGQKS